MNPSPALEPPFNHIDEIQRIGNEAVRLAQDNLRRQGIPLCFSRNGRIYYEMPDGSIQTENPYPEMLRQRGIVLPE
ncbi:MAG TPA: hypothetical protein VF630_02160 [Hymenobacter sp.]|jgi:hypothetical protein